MSRFGLMFTSLVIGSSKGIGKAIAYKLLECGQGPHTGIIKSYNEGKWWVQDFSSFFPLVSW